MLAIIAVKIAVPALFEPALPKSSVLSKLLVSNLSLRVDSKYNIINISRIFKPAMDVKGSFNGVSVNVSINRMVEQVSFCLSSRIDKTFKRIRII